MSEQLVIVQKDMYWSNIEEASSGAIVLIVAQIETFDWSEPYNSGEQYESRGTGFLINQDGDIVTTLHVINDAKSIWIIMPHLGQKLMIADIISVCPERDLAIIRLKKDDVTDLKKIMKELPTLPIGNSDLVNRAESVLSLGYPLGHGRLKGTTGVISGREWLQGQSMLQMTAPVNQGSSGGPLLNGVGSVIGITVAMDIDAYNVGYAIAINELLIMMEEMKHNKIARKPIFGARFVHSNDEKACFLGNPSPAGLYICTVIPGGLFEKAGVQEGDMLYEFDGACIDAFGEAAVSWSKERQSLPEIVSRVPIGQQVSLLVYRNGVQLRLLCAVSADNPFSIYRRFPMIEQIEYELFGGLVLMNLTDNHLEELMSEAPHLSVYTKIEEKIKPVVVVSHVVSGSYAHQLRSIRAGDLVCAINGIPVFTIQECRVAIKKNQVAGLVSILLQDKTLVVFSMKKIQQAS